MNGITIHTQSPITAAAKASGVTPKTAAPPTQPSQQVPSSHTATTTAAAAAESSYPAAQPGAAPAPAATDSAYKPAPRHSPTRTRSDGGPPPPQPGAIPVPFPTATAAGNTHIPQQQQAIPTPAPHPPDPRTSPPLPTMQTNHPTQQPSPPIAPHTSTSSVPLPHTRTLTNTIQLGEHPNYPGYVQNPYAAEPSPSQRAATADQDGGFYRGGYGGASKQRTGNGEDGMWDTAKKWARVAGEKVEKMESEAWKKINK